MSVKFGKTEAKAFLLAMGVPDPTPGDIAEALETLDIAFEIYESRASWMIIAGLAVVEEDGENLEGQFVCIGPYSTPGEARSAIEGTTLANQADERIMAYVHHGTPATLLTKRKKARQQLEKDAAGSQKMSFLVALHERDKAKAVLARRKAGLMSLEELKSTYPDSWGEKENAA